MKTEDEIQRAHDILAAIRLKEVEFEFKRPEDFAALAGSLDALCWILDHAHNKTFENNLDQIERGLAAAGYVLKIDRGAT